MVELTEGLAPVEFGGWVGLIYRKDGLRRFLHGELDCRARAATMVCCQHGESPCGGLCLDLEIE